MHFSTTSGTYGVSHLANILPEPLRYYVRGTLPEASRTVRLNYALRNIEHKEPILVFQMGKVGSKTVVRTVRALRLPNPTLHMHTLSDQKLRSTRRWQRASVSPFFHEHLIVSGILVRKLRRSLFPCKVIAITREPISRAISYVFERPREKIPAAVLRGGEVHVPSVIDSLEQRLSRTGALADPTTWFDRELKDVLGTDIFAEPVRFRAGLFYTSAELDSSACAADGRP